MSLADRLTTPPEPKRGPGCGIRRLLAILNDEDRDALKRVLAADSGWKHSDIASVILDEHPTFSASAAGAQQKIGDHRKGKCSCVPR